ncbi:MAG: hypothetical protein II767_06805 [Proteobacteria bacterium]|nr:hypothetical protein [Pseudomonadota bacterium]
MTDQITLKDSEQIERIRQAVLRRGCSVTVGDIMSETGLNSDDAKAGLSKLIGTHEGVIRVSETGEMIYVFKSGCIRRDERSWWERNKKAIYKFIKKLFKIIIFAVLVIYFIIYLVIILALIFGNRNSSSRSSFNPGIMIYYFWGIGGNDYSDSGEKREPIYTKVYNFVFGPEEAEVDPLEARTTCAQLIRAKNGILTVEDWILATGQSREKCESDLAKFTAEFNGTAEITNNGTLVYVFEDMLKSTRAGDRTSLPAPAWATLEQPRKLTANTAGGNAFVIGFNSFNLIMSSIIAIGGVDLLYSPSNPNDPYQAMLYAQKQAELAPTFFWLGFFPMIFSLLLFAVPLCRLPGNIKENRARKERNIRKASLLALSNASKSSKGTALQLTNMANTANNCLVNAGLKPASDDEIKAVMNDLCDELGGDIDTTNNRGYVFEDMDIRLKDAQQERNSRNLAHQDLGRVVYSSNQDEQNVLDEQNERADMDAFDRELNMSRGSYNNNYTPANARPASRPRAAAQASTDPFDIALKKRKQERGYDTDYTSPSDFDPPSNHNRPTFGGFSQG